LLVEILQKCEEKAEIAEMTGKCGNVSPADVYVDIKFLDGFGEILYSQVSDEFQFYLKVSLLSLNIQIQQHSQVVAHYSFL
jgi:hypothetical protein